MWGTRGAHPNEVPQNSAVEAQPRGKTSSTISAWESIGIHLHMLWYWETGSWWGQRMSGYVRLTGLERLGDLYGLLHKVLQTDIILIDRHLGSDLRICFFPSTWGRQSTELQSIITGRRISLTEADELVANRERAGGWAEDFLEMGRERVKRVDYSGLRVPDGLCPEQCPSGYQGDQEGNLSPFAGKLLGLHLYVEWNLE